MIRFPLSLARSVFVLSLCTVACGERRHSAAADVPATDVRRLPPERKAVVPDVVLLAADRGRALGADSARVQILVVGDAQCAACRQWFIEQWPPIRAQYVDRGLARMTFVNYPLRDHVNAVTAASALMCASAQGAFMAALQHVYEAQPSWGTASLSQATLDSIVGAAGTDARLLGECTNSGRLLRLIRSDIDWADSVQVGDLPVFVILWGHGQLKASAATFKAMLDSALSQAAPQPRP